MKVEAIWTGKWPNLCCGEWKLYIDGEDISHMIPDGKYKNHMETFGHYRRFRFVEDWEVVWDDYEEGLDYQDWIDTNEYWLKNISIDRKVQEQIFRAFQKNDWRHGSCGGCI